MKINVRIIRLAAISLLGISLFFSSVLIVEAAKNDKEESAVNLEITSKDIKITNVRDTTFNVSLATPKKQTCHIKYGINPAALNNICYDDRGNNINDDNHYITVGDGTDGESSLTPNTTYYFDIVLNDVVYDNGGLHFTCATGYTLGIPPSKTIYGKVLKKNGRENADGAIVYVTVNDKDGGGTSGFSAVMSCLVKDGYWYANLGNTRTAALNSYFYYSPSGDEIAIFAQGASEGVAIVNVNTGTQLPVPAINLEKGRDVKK